MSGHRIEESVGSALRQAGLGELASEAKERLESYAREVDLWSERIHLVGRGRLGKNIEMLLLDSLLLLRVAEESGLSPGKTADVGSGAGFPGIVWKIVRPNLELTLFERKLKPQLFLERVVARLGLEGVRVVGEEAGAFPETGTFSLVVSKAAGRLEVLLPLAEALLAPEGAYLTVKGRGWKSETREPRGLSMRLDAAVELPGNRGTAVIFRKMKTI